MHFKNLEQLKSPYFYFATNQKLELANVSRSVEDIFGYSRSQIIGSRYDQFMSQDDLNQDLESLGQSRFSHNIAGAKNSFRSVRDCTGKSRIIQMQCYGETDERGQVTQIIGFCRDISSEWNSFGALYEELNQLEELEQKLKDREKVVLQQVLDGKLNKTIARDLHVSERTIELDRKRLIEKFSAVNSASLIAKASRLSALREVFSWLNNMPTLTQVPVPEPTAKLPPVPPGPLGG